MAASDNAAAMAAVRDKLALSLQNARDISFGFGTSEEQRRTLRSAAVEFMLSTTQDHTTPLSMDQLSQLFHMVARQSNPQQQRDLIGSVLGSFIARHESPPAQHLRDTLDQLSALQDSGSEEQTTRLAKTAEGFAASVLPFPFLRLPPELRNNIYELCIPRGNARVPSPCHCHQWDPAVEPAITKVCREIRSESLPIFYDCNTIEFHTLRYNFSTLFAHCKRIRHWGVKKVPHVIVFISEAIFGQDDVTPTIRCGNGLWELCKWLATTEMDVNFECETDGNFAPIAGAIVVGQGIPR
ncbi:hypothetical protein LTR17_013332 [Elasticomyces elasticus]|nr:hypothetical protein LTR17_013332 [Elasticomyces elasticus]